MRLAFTKMRLSAHCLIFQGECMKPVYTTFALACSLALGGAVSAQTAQTGEATQHPSPSTDTQEISPVPDMQKTPPAPNAQMEQPVRPDAHQTTPETEPMTQTAQLAQDDQNFLENAIQGSYAEIE